MRFILFLVIIFVLSVTSCEKPCTKAQPIFSLIGFTDTEADTIILRKFAKNGSFSTPLDTALLDIRFNRSHDTLKAASFSGDAILFSDYNYQVFFPESSQLITITDIIENENTATEGLLSCTKKDACMNNISGYTINGQFKPMDNRFDLIYLKK